MVGYVVMKDADSAAYVIQASQAVKLLLPYGVLKADVISISPRNAIDYFSNLSMEQVPIALNDFNSNYFRTYCEKYYSNVIKPIKITKIKAQFQIKHSYFQDLHQAVENVSQAMIQKLFPFNLNTKEKFQKQNICDHSSISKEPLFKPDKLQSETISTMLSVSAETPFLLVGPFGTGKTHVLACAAAKIVNEDATAKVLIATHHNKSADTFITKYFGTLESTKVLPATVAPIRIATKDLSDNLEKPYFFRFNDPIITKELLDERRIVVTTFLTALRFASTEKLPRGYFTHILIDEGAQTREPETIAPLIFANETTKIIIAGDHLQVKTLLHMFFIIIRN